MSLVAAFRGSSEELGEGRGSPVVWGRRVSPLARKRRLPLELRVGCFVLVPGPSSAVCLLCDLRQCLSLSGSIRTARSFSLSLNFLETQAANQTCWF